MSLPESAYITIRRRAQLAFQGRVVQVEPLDAAFARASVEVDQPYWGEPGRWEKVVFRHAPHQDPLPFGPLETVFSLKTGETYRIWANRAADSLDLCPVLRGIMDGPAPRSGSLRLHGQVTERVSPPLGAFIVLRFTVGRVEWGEALPGQQLLIVGATDCYGEPHLSITADPYPLKILDTRGGGIATKAVAKCQASGRARQVWQGWIELQSGCSLLFEERLAASVNLDRMDFSQTPYPYKIGDRLWAWGEWLPSELMVRGAEFE